jgi:hypothetical protein
VKEFAGYSKQLIINGLLVVCKIWRLPCQIIKSLKSSRKSREKHSIEILNVSLPLSLRYAFSQMRSKAQSRLRSPAIAVIIAKK